METSVSAIDFFKMCIQLLCLTSNGGIPIFTRRSGNCKNLPFSTIASINGFHMFFKLLDIRVGTTFTDDWTYIWKDFDSTITLIIFGKGKSEAKLELIAEYVYCTFGLFIKKDDFSMPLLLNRMKREATKFMPIIDYILESNNDLGKYSNRVISVDSSRIFSKLNEFSAQCGCQFCSIVLNLKTVVGTEGWWSLNNIDRFLLLSILKSAKSPQNDIAIYLPSKSPMIAYRFVTVMISENCILCVVCGSEPLFHDISSRANGLFGSEHKLLRKAQESTSLTTSKIIETDQNIQGVIILNEIGEILALSTKIRQNFIGKSVTSCLQRLTILRKILDNYYRAIKSCSPSLTDDEIADISPKYGFLKYHKYFVKSDENGNSIFLLFATALPAYTNN